MSKHIGIVACSADGAALCYRTICIEATVRMGEYTHPEVSMHTHPLNEYLKHLALNNWNEVAKLMLISVRKLADIGAELAICSDNTLHQAFNQVIAESPIPWFHIAEAVAAEAKKQGYSNLAITGTKYLMTGPVYAEALKKFNISSQIPDKDDREKINTIIFKELINGIFLEKSRLYFNEVIQKLKGRGCDAVVLGCTEIPLLVDPDDCPLPILDSTRLLARAAINEAL